MTLITRSFYARDTSTVAKELLGAVLVRTVNNSTISGIIVETEAYYGTDDPASHAYRGMTKRTAVMFGPVGHAYVYFIYGNYYSLNIVAKQADTLAGGVLIRAVEPLDGIEYMQRNRGNVTPINLTNGPGKLAMAFNITRELNGVDCTHRNQLFLEHGLEIKKNLIVTTARVGISQAIDAPLRFHVKNNLYVSRR